MGSLTLIYEAFGAKVMRLGSGILNRIRLTIFLGKIYITVFRSVEKYDISFCR